MKEETANGNNALPSTAPATNNGKVEDAKQKTDNNDKDHKPKNLTHIKSPQPPPPPAELSQEEAAWWPSKLYFMWAKPLFQRAAALQKEQKALFHDDLLLLSQTDKSSNIAPLFAQAWEKAARELPAPVAKGLEDLQKDTSAQSTVRTQRSLMRSVLGRRFYMAGVIKIFNTGLQFTFPLLLRAILKFVEETQAGKFSDSDPWQDQYRGYWLSVVLFLAMASKAVTENMYFQNVYRCGYQARIAVSTAVYSKALRLANAERQSTTLGELINLMQVDATKIEMFVPQIHVLWDGMVQITGYITILYTLIGWPCFAGLIIMLAAGPMQGVIMKQLFALNRQMVKYTDTRVKTTNEALQGMQCVKMYTWEDSFARNIAHARSTELNFLQRVAYLRGISRAYMTALPGVVAVGSFVVYALAKDGAKIEASVLFAALVAFDQLRFPLLFYPMALAQLAQAKVSAARVEVFLGMKEVGRGEDFGNGKYTRAEDDHQGEIRVQDAVVYWSDPSIPISVSQHSSSIPASAGGGGGGDDTSTADSELGPGKRYPRPILKNLSFHVPTGQLCAVVGPVASGKSTLCAAILNETLLESGHITLKGRVAYAAQSPWVLNASLRDNILFGLPYDEVKYQQVIQACQLTHDLEMLEDGDRTEIGERGINLSGGQKQRVSVARAAYSDADTIILDDPLSALDPEVAKKLFDECIVKLMKGKTVLLVTNQLQFLRYCDTIVALQNGTVIEQGSFSDLMAIESGEIKRLLAQSKAGEEKEKVKTEKQHITESADGVEVIVSDGSLIVDDDNDPEHDPATEDKIKAAAVKKDAKGLVSEEERMIGAVSLDVYKQYFHAGGGFSAFFLVYIVFIVSTGNTLASTAWLSYWTSDDEYKRHSQAFYLGLYFTFAVTLGISTFCRVFLLAGFGIRASNNLHSRLLYAILHAPQSFFDTTPIGRIISRFSKDLYSIDVELIEQLDFFISMTLQVIMSIGTIMYVTPWFGIAVLPLGVFYLRVLNYFRQVSRETKRLESISRSPVYAQFSETLGGLPTLRAYAQVDRFMNEFEDKVDQNTRAYYSNKSADRWLSVRLESIGAMIAGLAAVFSCNVAIEGSVSGQASDSNFASLAGLSLTFAISLTGMLNWCVRTFAMMEAAMNSVERVLYYSGIQQEAPFTSDELKRRASSDKPPPSNPSVFAVAACGGETAAFDKDWPNNGQIVLNNLKMRYRSDTPLVLKGLNVTIDGGERIGVVGRTGSGKSSLLLTLLRLVEPALEDDEQNYQPPISIDGIDVLRIGLQELRSKLGIIPQNPVLFSGTIRSNIDPFNMYSDEQIWQALDRCGMKTSVLAMPGELDASVAEYGENLSAGMRQMLVLGRALLRQCRVLLLDEATSSVDFETDRAIQRTIREAFPGCTVITIAHRINTIMDSTKILVMKDGLAAEFAPPEELLKDEKSLFSEIVRHSKSQHH